MRTHPCIAVLAGLALAASVCACAASNPTRTNEPAPWEPKPKSEAPPASTSANKSKAPAQDAKPSAAGASTQAADAASPTSAPSGADPAKSEAAPNSTAPKSAAAGAGADAQKSKSDPSAQAGTADGAVVPLDKAPHDPADKTPHSTEPIVARVAGEPIYVSELFEQVMYSDTLGMLQQLDTAVMARLVVAEAKRLHVHIDSGLDSTAYEDRVKAAEAQYAKQFPNMPLDRFVSRVLGLDPIKYRDHLREDSRQMLLASRAARAWLLQQEHADMHVIIVDKEDDVKLVQKDLADGMAFEDVARKRSVDPSKEKGGQVVPMVRKDTPLGKLAFETDVGKVGGPLTDHGAWLFVRVDAVHPAMEGDWSRIGSAVEDSLKERDIDTLEIRQWRAAMLDRYTVEVSPFLNLVGETDH